jgi:hypothetical protein
MRSIANETKSPEGKDLKDSDKVWSMDSVEWESVFW